MHIDKCGEKHAEITLRDLGEERKALPLLVGLRAGDAVGVAPVGERCRRLGARGTLARRLTGRRGASDA